MIILHTCLRKCKEILENKELIQSYYENDDFKTYLKSGKFIKNDITIIKLPSFRFSITNGICHNADLSCMYKKIIDNLELVGLGDDEFCSLHGYTIHAIIDHIAHTYFLKKYGGIDNIPSDISYLYPINYDLKNLWLEDERWEYLNHVISYLEKMIERLESL